MISETVILEIIVNGGSARSNSLNAIRLAKKGKIDEAKDSIKKAEEDLQKAHGAQTALIQGEAAGNKAEISLLMVHAQDHLMNAMTIKDLANEMIDMYGIFKANNLTLSI